MPFWQQWMIRSDLLVPETSTHTALSIRHTSFLPGFSQRPAEHWDSLWAPPQALAVLVPELGLLKSLFLSAGAGSCHQVKQTQMLLSHMPEVCTAHHRSIDGFHQHWPCCGKAPGEECVVSLGRGTFCRDLESTLLSPERLQKSKLLKLLMHSDKLSCTKKSLLLAKGRADFPQPAVHFTIDSPPWGGNTCLIPQHQQPVW